MPCRICGAKDTALATCKFCGIDICLEKCLRWKENSKGDWSHCCLRCKGR